MATIQQFVLAKWRRFDAAVDATLDADSPTARAAIESAALARPDVSEAQLSILDFEQFVIGTVMLNRAFIAGETSEMGDWIQWALTNVPTDDFKHEMYVGRVEDFYRIRVIYEWPRFHDIMVAFFTALYEYARRRTAFLEVCVYLLPLALKTFYSAMERPPQFITGADIHLGTFILTWMAKEQPEEAADLAQRLEGFATAARLAKRQRYAFALALSTAGGSFSSRGSHHWADYAMRRLNAHASDMDRVQLNATLMRTDVHGSADAEALITLMEVARSRRSSGQTQVRVAREAAISTILVQPYFVKVLAMGRADLVLRGLQTWYRQGSVDDGPDSERLLVSLPFGESCSSYLCERQLVELARETQWPLLAVSRAMNSFLQTYATVAGADNSDLEIPERPGYPLEHQDGLIEALIDAYCPAGIEIPGDPSAQLILPTEGHPIQATQLQAWGRTWPIASSLARPRRDRQIRKALLWGGGDALSAGMELDMVEHALSKAGVRVVRPAPPTYTRELFLELYRDAAFDLVWVASHGEFDHWKPHEVQLELARHLPKVGLEELWGLAPETEERRLLFLNVCDGARFADPGLLPRVGLAPGLAAGCQATISHLWPVRLYPSAALGALLGHAIARGLSFFEAYVSALQGLAKPAQHVAKDLERLYGRRQDGGRFELVERLEMQEVDFSRIETWGSAAFFE
ncbi:CHAT domain-containing protein [Roseateles sp. L2-2]|uniref:CHAT domain-containing protein n=1 Tax=Roseateles sp. L2-2 TaxID=3422597 RepID=UPI003D3679C7